MEILPGHVAGADGRADFEWHNADAVDGYAVEWMKRQRRDRLEHVVTIEKRMKVGDVE